MSRSFFALCTLGSLFVFGCSAGSEDMPATSAAPDDGMSLWANTSDELKGCKGKASSTIPSNGNYILTTFGNGAHDDGIMSCGQYTKHGSWYYAASRQRYGCGARVKVEANGKCVVAETDDYGPDVCVENAAGKPILDVSPLVAKALFGVSGAGYSDKLLVHVTEVPESTPLGACKAQVCTPGSKRCNSASTAVEVCKADGSGYTKSESCSSGCDSGTCTISSCTPDWACGAWSACDCAGKQTRACTDSSQCGSSAGKPATSQACDPCADASSTCTQCGGSGGCGYGTKGEHNDSCAGVPEETWRCVYSDKLGTTVSQVCRDKAGDGSPNWISYYTEPANCDACCGSYGAACE